MDRGAVVHVEPIGQLKTRYRAAVAKIRDVRAIQAGDIEDPIADHDALFFDSDNGVRLSISRDRLMDGRVGVHFSGSFHDPVKAGLVAAGQAKETVPILAAFEMHVLTWRSIAGSSRVPEVLGVSEDGVCHFFVEDMN